MNSAIKNMKIGILGAGHIAGTFAHTIRHTEGALCYAVASRSYEKAAEFAKQYDFSGGQIDNIVRKIAMNEVIAGERPSIIDIHDMCKCEKIDKPDGEKRIGFCV